MKLYQDIKRARNVSVPLIALETSDQKACIQSVSKEINGDGAKYRWNTATGLHPLNEAAESCMPCDGEDLVGDPASAVMMAAKIPAEGVMFIENAHRFLESDVFIQAISNVRDILKTNHRMLILLAPFFKLPAEIQNSVVVLSEPLPSAEQAQEIIEEVLKAAEIEGDIDPHAVAAVQGLPAFQVEQLTAMCLSKDGLDVGNLWDAKKKHIENTPGLSVFRGGSKFECLEGLDPVKEKARRRGAGRLGCNAVLWIDEGGDQFGGMEDMTGITKDYHGQLLQYMEDRRARGFILYGHPGTGKSMIAKCSGAEIGVPTIRIDLGAMMGSLVGQSQQHLRHALAVVDAISGGKVIAMLTTNDMGTLSPQLQARFTSGIYFFDLMTKAERQGAWTIHRTVYDLLEDESHLKVDDAGWVGRDIRDCCEAAWDMDMTIQEAAKSIVPVAMSCPEDIKKRQEQAHGKYLDASKTGVYMRRIDQESAVRSIRT